jgi:hypothetical protein
MLTESQKKAVKAQLDLVKSHIVSGEYTKAREALSYLDNHPDAQVIAMVERARTIISQHENEKKGIKKAKPSASKSNSNNKLRNILLFVLLSVLAIPLILITVASIWQEVFISDQRLEFAWHMMCSDIVGDVIIANDDIEFTESIFNAYYEECARQAKSTVSINRDEVLLCYQESNKANLDVQFQNCLAENDAFIDSEMLGVVINAAR